MMPLLLGMVYSQAHALHLGEEWYRYTTQDVELISDLPEKRAKLLLHTIHLFSRGLEQAEILPPRTNEQIKRPTLLISRSHYRFRRFVDQPHIAGLASTRLNDVVLIVSADRGWDRLDENTLHEYSHYLLRTANLGWPLWVEEGLATILGSSRINVRQGTMEFGRYPIATLGRLLKERDYVTAISATTTKRGSMMRFYQASAHLTHYLALGPGRATLTTPFGYASHPLLSQPTELRKALRTYSRRGPEIRKVQLEQFAAPEAQRELMTEHDTLQTIAGLLEPINPPFARRLYTELLSHQPSYDPAVVGTARTYSRTEPEIASSMLEGVLLKNPNDLDAMLAQSMLLTDGCLPDGPGECRDRWLRAAEILRNLLAQDHSRIDAAYQLGLTELYVGRSHLALGYLQLAHKFAPWSAPVNFHLGECLRLLGRPQAMTHLRQAQAWATSGALRKLASEGIRLASEDLDLD